MTTSRRPTYIAAFMLFAVYASASIVRYRVGGAHFFDMGIYNNQMWLLAHGDAHSALINRNIFSDHAAFVLLLIAPLYRALPFGETLLVVQAAAVACSLIPLVHIAERMQVRRSVVVLLVFLSAPLISAVMFDFHPSTLAVPAMCWAVLFVLQDRQRLLAVALLAVIFCRADLVTFVIALWVAGGFKRTRVTALVVFIGAVAVVVPSLLVPQDNFKDFYGQLGSSPTDILLHPGGLIAQLFSGRTAQLLLFWLLPVGGLCLLAPRWMLGALIAGSPTLLLTLPGAAQPWLHYSALVVPFTFTGAFIGIRKINAYRPSLRPILNTWAIFGAGVALLVASPVIALILRPESVTNPFTRDHFDASALAAVTSPDAPLVAGEDIVPYLANRKELHVFPLPFERVPSLAIPVDTSAPARIKQVVICDEEFWTSRDVKHGARCARDRAKAEQFGFDREVASVVGYDVLERPEP